MSTVMEEISIEQDIVSLNEHLADFCKRNICDTCKLKTSKGNCFKQKAQEKLVKRFNEGE